MDVRKGGENAAQNRTVERAGRPRTHHAPEQHLGPVLGVGLLALADRQHVRHAVVAPLLVPVWAVPPRGFGHHIGLQAPNGVCEYK